MGQLMRPWGLGEAPGKQPVSAAAANPAFWCFHTFVYVLRLQELGEGMDPGAPGHAAGCRGWGGASHDCGSPVPLSQVNESSFLPRARVGRGREAPAFLLMSFLYFPLTG